MQRDITAVISMPVSNPSAPPAFARVDILSDEASILDASNQLAWADLESQAPCSIYQTRAFLLPWMQTLGKKAGVTPFFVLARGADDRPVAFLPLGISRLGPLKIAAFLGGRDSNLNLPLMRPEIVWTPTELRRLLREAARASVGHRPDLFYLVNQPFEWNGRANPLAQLRHQEAPSAAYGAPLPADAEAFFAAKLSKDTRKKLRKKEAKLAAIGPVTHLVVADVEAQKRVIDSFVAQKVARFRAKKIVSEFETPEMRRFIEIASPPQGAGIELHALLAGERIVAIYGGAAHDGQWSGMFNAFDTDEEISKSSPGDLLLMRIIAKACADGLTRFDLGIGEARYKAALCDTKISLFDGVVPVSMAGRMMANVFALRQKVKRKIKSDPRLFKLALRLSALRD